MTRLFWAAVTLLFLQLCSADARPRDDVMAGVFRCSGLESDREWLDCYYGAAQPARAGLGLKPALPGQVKLAQSPPIMGQARPSAVRNRVITDAGRCYDQEDDRRSRAGCGETGR